MGKKQVSDNRKRKKSSGRVLAFFAFLFTFLFIGGSIGLGVMYYIDQKNAAVPTVPVLQPEVERETETPTLPIETLEPETEAPIAETTEETTELSTTEEESTTEDPVLSLPDLELREEVLKQYTNLGVITGVRNYLNMRSGPSTDHAIVGVIFKNCGVEILEDHGEWMKISSGGVEGYVASEYITTGEQARRLALLNMRHCAEAAVERVPVYDTADIASEVITHILKGEKYDIVGDDGSSMLYVEAVLGRPGYVEKQYITTGYVLDEAIVFSVDGVSEQRCNLIRDALNYYGGTYVWGGKELTPEGGVDCSGYTMCIYRKYGITLPEFSGAQAGCGNTVTEETIRPGDLIFYVGRYPGVIGHVAIYIGNGKILHAASERLGICIGNWKYLPPVIMKNVFKD